MAKNTKTSKKNTKAKQKKSAQPSKKKTTSKTTRKNHKQKQKKKKQTKKQLLSRTATKGAATRAKKQAKTISKTKSSRRNNTETSRQTGKPTGTARSTDQNETTRTSTTQQPVIQQTDSASSPQNFSKKESPTTSNKAHKEEVSPSKKSFTTDEVPEINLKTVHPPEFIAKQKAKLEQLRDALLDQMADVAQDSLRSASDVGGGAAFGQHMGDAGSEAYERDFAFTLLSQEQDSLYEINEALRRIEMGTYGMCEKSGKPIPKERLEAIPWARYTVECQRMFEKTNVRRNRWESVPQFMDTSESDEETDEEDFEEESHIKT